jgi:hypothetical protein
MRFSLKWILGGTVYVAIAAAAFGTGKWYFADALWTIGWLAVVYAIAVAMFAAGKRRAMAATFVVGCACFLLSLMLGGEAVPTERLLVASGVGQSGPGNWMANPPAITGQMYSYVTVQPSVTSPQPTPAGSSTWNLVAPAYSAGTISTPSTLPVAPVATPAPIGPVDFSVYLRAAIAVATLAFGLMGSLVGLMAYRGAAVEGGREEAAKSMV